jgi:hypothetical protein
MLASRVLAADDATTKAIQRRDAEGARQLARVFLGVYPDIDVLLVDPNGGVLAQVGCDQPPSQITGIPELAGLAGGKEMEGVIAHGCESAASSAPPAYAIGVPLAVAGAVVVCLPIDDRYLKNASAKLGRAHQRGHLRADETCYRGAGGERDHGEGAAAAGDDLRGAGG